MKKGLTFIIFILAAMAASAQNCPAQSANGLLFAIQNSKPDTNRIRLQLKLGNYYHSKPLSQPAKPGEYKHNQDSAINLFTRALQLSMKMNQTDWQYNALDGIAECDGEIEKEWLLKEVHHRVKNNLHTVICLLESQALYLENDALKAIENSQHRIYATSLIHQKLYLSDDIKAIDMAEYIPELIRSLEDGFGTSDQIEFKLKVDPVNLTMSLAIPLGLIINEAVTNSIKYAFPLNRKGEISISMLNYWDHIQLELADNGIGMPNIAHDAEPDSLGLRLMKGLSEDIDAYISFEIENGTRICIKFEHDGLNAPENLFKEPKTKEIPV